VTTSRWASAKAQTFSESVIREMSRLCAASGGVNLAQGFPDFACPQELKDAAKAAIDGDVNQYAITWGAKAFRDGIAEKVARTYPGWSVDPETELCVTCGSTEAMIATLLATVDPGDEVIVFQPFYENYGPDAVLSGATPRYVTLRAPDWSIDEQELRAAFSDRTRAIIVNTPHNPTGKVFSREELDLISELCQRHDALCLTDEIYEHLVYDDACGLDDRAARHHGEHPQGARLPHRGGACAAAGRRCGGDGAARRLLRAHRCGLPRAARAAVPGARRRRVHLPRARRRLLRAVRDRLARSGP
jgi:aspartate/methionine/tyrosine aminotransferase